MYRSARFIAACWSKDAGSVPPDEVYPLLRVEGSDEDAEVHTYRQMKTMVERMGAVPKEFE